MVDLASRSCYNDIKSELVVIPMTQETADIMRDIASLPPEARKQVADFVAFLKGRYPPGKAGKPKRMDLQDEPFIGMWRDRQDMRDSSTWVKQLRRSEWGEAE